MKKLFYVAALTLALGAVSCNKSENCDNNNFFSAEATDSLVIAFGQAAGYGLNMQITNAMQQNPSITKAEYLKGMQYAMAADSSETYINGMIAGLQIQTQIKRFERMGIKVNTTTLLNSFKEAFLADSLPSSASLSIIENNFRHWSDSLNQAKKNYDMEQLLSSPEAIENAEKGQAYIKQIAESNDSVKIAESGLAYKIINAGEEPKVTPAQRVVLKYVARKADGTVVDQVNGTPVSLISRPAGLREGVTMLGKGGKAQLYVPGNLAYGVDVPQRMDLGLNELIIYDVEVVDTPAAPSSQPLQ